MRKILRDLRDAVAECRAQAASDSQSQLFAIIRATSTPAKPTPCPCAPARFLGRQHAPAGAARLQRANDRRLYSNICCQFRRELPLRQARDARAAGGNDRWALAARQPAGDETDLKQDCRIACDYVARRLNAAQPLG